MKCKEEWEGLYGREKREERQLGSSQVGESGSHGQATEKDRVLYLSADHKALWGWAWVVFLSLETTTGKF